MSTPTEITPETTTAEHAAVLAEQALAAGVDPLLHAAEESLRLRRRIQTALEVCEIDFMNLYSLADSRVSGYAVQRDEVVDALKGNGPVVLPRGDIGRLDDVTRITVVGPDGGRAHEAYGYAGVELHLQDDGRTLKVLPRTS